MLSDHVPVAALKPLALIQHNAQQVDNTTNRHSGRYDATAKRAATVCSAATTIMRRAAVGVMSHWFHFVKTRFFPVFFFQMSFKKIIFPTILTHETFISIEKRVVPID